MCKNILWKILSAILFDKVVHVFVKSYLGLHRFAVISLTCKSCAILLANYWKIYKFMLFVFKIEVSMFSHCTHCHGLMVVFSFALFGCCGYVLEH